MKNNTLKIVIVAVVIIGFFLLGRCSKECKTETKTVTVTVPQKQGKFESPTILKPQSTNIKTAIQFKDSIIYVPQVNEELVQQYLAQKSELERLKSYTNAIAINEYENVFDNDDVKIIVKAKTEGKLLELKPEYTIKPQTVTTNIDIPKPKERVFSMNIGAGINTTKQLDKLDPSIHLDLVNKKGNILSASYSVDGVVGIKYSVNLFNIKK